MNVSEVIQSTMNISYPFRRDEEEREQREEMREAETPEEEEEQRMVCAVKPSSCSAKMKRVCSKRGSSWRRGGERGEAITVHTNVQFWQPAARHVVRR